MIPLIRPRLPSLTEIEPFYNMSSDSGQFSNFGPVYDLLKKKLSQTLNCYPVICSDGTSAIKIALEASVPRGTRVLIPDFTHIGTLNAVMQAGLTPVMAACNKKTLTLEINEIKKHRDKIGAFVVVSPFGYKVDFERYDEISESLNIPVIYDLAGAWGMEVRTKNPYTFSLHATKNFSCGEGGIACFSQAALAEWARKSTNFFTNSDRTIDNPYGSNCKASEITCAIALAHLLTPDRLQAKVIKKQRLISQYQAALEKIVVVHDRHIGNAAPSLCVLGGLDANNLELYGMRNEVTLKQYYIPLSRMNGLNEVERVSVSSPFFDTFLALPSDATDSERDATISLIKRFYS